jgi:hypothetical protein
MLGQHYAEQTPEAAPPQDVPVGRGLPGWRITLRRTTLNVVERVLGTCLAATPTRGVLVLLAVLGLLAVITVTLSVGNALLVLLAGAIMRISCEYRAR